MIMTTSDAEIASKKRINEQIGYSKGKVETMRSCLNDIKSITEHDIWYPAWKEVEEGLNRMTMLLEKGMIR